MSNIKYQPNILGYQIELHIAGSQTYFLHAAGQNKEVERQTKMQPFEKVCFVLDFGQNTSFYKYIC